MSFGFPSNTKGDCRIEAALQYGRPFQRLTEWYPFPYPIHPPHPLAPCIGVTTCHKRANLRVATLHLDPCQKHSMDSDGGQPPKWLVDKISLDPNKNHTQMGVCRNRGTQKVTMFLLVAFSDSCPMIITPLKGERGRRKYCNFVPGGRIPYSKPIRSSTGRAHSNIKAMIPSQD